MTALDDICKALGEAPPVEHGKRRFVIIGKSAELAIQAQTQNATRAKRIGEFPLIYADDHSILGWDIVDKPLRFRP